MRRTAMVSIVNGLIIKGHLSQVLGAGLPSEELEGVKLVDFLASGDWQFISASPVVQRVPERVGMDESPHVVIVAVLELGSSGAPRAKQTAPPAAPPPAATAL